MRSHRPARPAQSTDVSGEHRQNTRLARRWSYVITSTSIERSQQLALRSVPTHFAECQRPKTVHAIVKFPAATRFRRGWTDGALAVHIYAGPASQVCAFDFFDFF